MGRLTTKCPHCGDQTITAEFHVIPGWKGDYFNPPEPDEMGEITSIDYECVCRKEIEADYSGQLNTEQRKRQVEIYDDAVIENIGDEEEWDDHEPIEPDWDAIRDMRRDD